MHLCLFCPISSDKAQVKLSMQFVCSRTFAKLFLAYIPYVLVDQNTSEASKRNAYCPTNKSQ